MSLVPSNSLTQPRSLGSIIKGMNAGGDPSKHNSIGSFASTNFPASALQSFDYSGDDAPACQSLPEAAGGTLPQWLCHPLNFKSYVQFRPWPELEYRKVQKLASAIHGKIYLYEHIPTKKSVVIKKMPSVNVVSFNPNMLEDALTEIGVSTFLSYVSNSLNICKMFGVYQDHEYTYFVTEFSSGGELFEHVVQEKCFPEERAKKVILEVVEAVRTLHANGIIHRDISLENTLLHGDGSARVIDFGQSVPLWNPRGPMKNTLARLSGKAGKAYYRAPEMYLGAYFGPPVDVFAIGVMLFIMTVGTPPWNHATQQDARFRYIEKNGVRKLLESWGKTASMSPELLDLLHGTMNCDPRRRISIEECWSHPWFDSYKTERNRERMRKGTRGEGTEGPLRSPEIDMS